MIQIEVGFQLKEPLARESASVVRSLTPGGQAAKTTHVGPYDRLGETHAAIRDGCVQNGQTITGQNWEVSGQWRDTPEELRSDVYDLRK